MLRLCTLLLLSFSVVFADRTPICTNDFTLVNNKCLKLYTQSSNHAAAERTCMDSGATLVNIKNAIDNRALSTFIGNGASVVWIGLFCTDSSVDQCYWDDSTGSAKLYNSFSGGFPLVDVGRCASYSTQGALAGKWINVNCEDTLKGFVCELPTTYADHYCQQNYNGYCYWLPAISKFSNAQYECERSCGSLVSIHSANENRYIETFINSFGNGAITIGAVQTTPNSFSWTDGTAWDYNNIDTDYLTDSACLGISNAETFGISSGSWRSISCSDQHQFICKRPVGNDGCTTPPPRVTATPDPSNPSHCNSPLLFAPGVITSPNFPNTYPQGSSCTYSLATLGPSKISIYFSYIYISQYDSVQVYDSDNTRIGYISGSKSPVTLTSTGNTMFLKFSGQNPYGYTGFSATFSSLPV